MAETKKGSQGLLQKFVNVYPGQLNQHILSSSPSLLVFLGEELSIQWKSPLVEENYYEYQDDFLNVYYADKEKTSLAMQEIRKYWPRNGPVWDGLAVVERKDGQKGLLLVEAKAHVSETASKIKASSPASIETITETLLLTKGVFQSITPITAWLNEYYQLANRLAFLYLLNTKLHIPAWLLLVNFVDDQSYKSTSLNTWLQHYQKAFERLGMHPNTPLMGKIINIFPVDRGEKA